MNDVIEAMLSAFFDLFGSQAHDAQPIDPREINKKKINYHEDSNRVVSPNADDGDEVKVQNKDAKKSMTCRSEEKMRNEFPRGVDDMPESFPSGPHSTIYEAKASVRA